MAIEIHFDGELYTATATPPHADSAWSTEQPMTVDQLDAALRERGCHPTDIGDAFYAADPDWVSRSSVGESSASDEDRLAA